MALTHPHALLIRFVKAQAFTFLPLTFVRPCGIVSDKVDQRISVG